MATRAKARTPPEMSLTSVTLGLVLAAANGTICYSTDNSCFMEKNLNGLIALMIVIQCFKFKFQIIYLRH
ncbi:hypothetical protein JB92DRAFT_2854439 [Gautieria morchelliformis]|nr:hypothetical protein JB92DRAFT_2854439 [Gautieria morchelliformis]